MDFVTRGLVNGHYHPMSLALCETCRRFARPFARCPFCNSDVGAPKPRTRIRAARNGILAATAALSLTCGGTVSSDDSGADAAHDRAADAPPTDSDIIRTGEDASAADAGSDVDSDVYWMPPPPYGSPPIPLTRIV